MNDCIPGRPRETRASIYRKASSRMMFRAVAVTGWFSCICCNQLRVKVIKQFIGNKDKSGSVPHTSPSSFCASMSLVPPRWFVASRLKTPPCSRACSSKLRSDILLGPPSRWEPSRPMNTGVAAEMRCRQPTTHRRVAPAFRLIHPAQPRIVSTSPLMHVDRPRGSEHLSDRESQGRGCLLFVLIRQGLEGGGPGLRTKIAPSLSLIVLSLRCCIIDPRSGLVTPVFLLFPFDCSSC
jgi:hypothetical protein